MQLGPSDAPHSHINEHASAGDFGHSLPPSDYAPPGTNSRKVHASLKIDAAAHSVISEILWPFHALGCLPLRTMAISTASSSSSYSSSRLPPESLMIENHRHSAIACLQPYQYPAYRECSAPSPTVTTTSRKVRGEPSWHVLTTLVSVGSPG